MNERKDRVEGAHNVTRAAVGEEIVPSRGVAYERAPKILESAQCYGEDQLGAN